MGAINDKSYLIIDKLLTVDDTGMPQAPSITQLLDPDIRKLYQSDKTVDKKNYIADCIVIYYLGDPKSPANQNGLSVAESLKMAIEAANLPHNYIPSPLVLKLIERYHNQNIGEAGIVVENIIKSLHNINLLIQKANALITDKLNNQLDIEAIKETMQLSDDIIKKAGLIPAVVKQLQEAKENLIYEKETETSRGGKIVTSSMNADDYE